MKYRQVVTGAIEIQTEKIVLGWVDALPPDVLIDKINAASTDLLDVIVEIQEEWIDYDNTESKLVVTGWRPATADELKQIEAEMLAAQQHSQQLSEQSNRRREQLNARGIRVARYEE